MPVCPSGSELIPGRPSVVHLDPGSMASYLPTPLAWLIPFLPYLPSIDLDMAAFCALEPPADQLLDANDIINLMGINGYQLAFLAGEKVAQVVHQQLWYAYCRCKTPDPAPTPPPGQSAPTGLPVLNPVGTNPSQPGCDSYTSLASGVPNSQFINHLNRDLPSSAVTIKGNYVSVVNGATHNTVQWSLAWLNGQGGSIKTESLVTVTSGSTVPFSYSVPAGAKFVSASVTAGPASTTDLQHIEYTVDCGLTAAPAPPAYYPAPDVRIGQILELVTLIQRQAVPFAIIQSTIHSGLTGQGTITVQGLIGALVQLTTIPSSYGFVDGLPDVHMDVAWITWGDVLGWRRSERVSSTPYVSMPWAAGELTTIAYSLKPGVVATIRELKREA